MTGPSEEIRPKVCYVLDFLPTYVVREAAETARWGIAPEIHLPLTALSDGLWERVLSDIVIPDGSIPRRDVRKDWCTAPAGRLLRQALPSALAGLLANPVRCTRLACDSLRRGTFRYFLAGAELAATLRGTGADLIHSHFARDAAQIAFQAASLLGIPFTVTTHATDLFSPEDPDRVAALLGGADGIHTISEFNRGYIADRYGEGLRGRILVSRLGLDVSGLPPRDPAGAGDSPSFVCTASGLVPKKGVEVLLEACRILSSRAVSFTCSVLGSDPGGERLESYGRMAAGMGLSEAVTFPGLLSSLETLRCVSSCTAFVLPAVKAPNGDMDGIPVSLMEAMAMGIPSISTRLSGIPELIEDGVSGLLVDPGDPTALAGAMERLASDPELSARLGAAGRGTVISRFSVDRYASDLISFWRNVLSTRGTEGIRGRSRDGRSGTPAGPAHSADGRDP